MGRSLSASKAAWDLFPRWLALLTLSMKGFLFTVFIQRSIFLSLHVLIWKQFWTHGTHGIRNKWAIWKCIFVFEPGHTFWMIPWKLYFDISYFFQWRSKVILQPKWKFKCIFSGNLKPISTNAVRSQKIASSPSLASKNEVLGEGYCGQLPMREGVCKMNVEKNDRAFSRAATQVTYKAGLTVSVISIFIYFCFVRLKEDNLLQGS